MRVKANHGAYSAPRTIEGESNDCAVRALMVAACIDYTTAHILCKRAGRVNGKGMCGRELQIAITLAGFAARRKKYFPKITEYWSCNGPYARYMEPQLFRRRVYPTLAEFATQHPIGHYIIETRLHFLAICDGIVHDWNFGKRGARVRRGVIAFWRLV